MKPSRACIILILLKKNISPLRNSKRRATVWPVACRASIASVCFAESGGIEHGLGLAAVPNNRAREA